MGNLFYKEYIFHSLEINNTIDDLVEIGCGYGTFTIPVSKIIKGNLYAFDIENEMIEFVRQKSNEQKLKNIILNKRDILSGTTGLKSDSIDYVMLFNLLHNEEPQIFIKECYRILKVGGKLGVIHWRSDIETPRGPDLSIRPSPQDILGLIDKKLFHATRNNLIFKPYHFGLQFSKLK